MYSESGSSWKAGLTAFLVTLLFTLALGFFFPGLPYLFWQAVWNESSFLPCLLLSLLVGLLVWGARSLYVLRERCAAMQLSIDQAMRRIDGLTAKLKEQQEKLAP